MLALMASTNLYSRSIHTDTFDPRTTLVRPRSKQGFYENCVECVKMLALMASTNLFKRSIHTDTFDPRPILIRPRSKQVYAGGSI
jgi:hypothetical protein